MRIAALLVALFIVVVGIAGIVSPEIVTTARRQYFATPVGLYAAGAVRVAMGLVLILVARVSRAPRILRTLGTLMCAQALAATLLGLDRAQAILEWEVTHPMLLRAGAIVALASGGFVALAVAKSSDGR
jgi:ribose/xylose/arabinose/galactoside ABC-type transport system permease subunit